MTSDQIFPSKYLKADDLDGEMTVTIKSVVLEELESKDRGKQSKPVAYFREFDKGVVLNRTNWGTIAKQHGDDSDMWVGKQIVLFAMDVEAFGEMVLAIRVKLPRPQSKLRPAAPAPVQQEPPPSGAPPATDADNEITNYWLEVKRQGLTRQDGLKLLNANKQDFKLAMKALLEDGQIPF